MSSKCASVLNYLGRNLYFNVLHERRLHQSRILIEADKHHCNMAFPQKNPQKFGQKAPPAPFPFLADHCLSDNFFHPVLLLQKKKYLCKDNFGIYQLRSNIHLEFSFRIFFNVTKTSEIRFVDMSSVLVYSISAKGGQ